jgi:nuclear factor related to kappa-B-binding protein
LHRHTKPKIFICCFFFTFSQPEIFFDVVSLSTWQEVLSDSQREHLQQFLPRFPADSVEQQRELILALFSGENFRFGNPLHIAQKLFRGL